MSEEPNDNKVKTAYERLGSRMKSRLQASKKKAEETRLNGFGRLEKQKGPVFLPDELVARILGLKGRSDLPETLLPSSHFEKKGRRANFLRRLAADVLDFGRAYQRAYSTFPAAEEVIGAFMEQRDYWECDAKDVSDAIKGLQDSGVLGTEDGRLIFEALSLSKDITSLLREVWQQKKEYWTSAELASAFRWSEEKSREVLETLNKERICTKDDEGYWFTGFSK
ncbi:MAG: hypothetical protein ACFFGZ_06295 [Candidatus Thorarchaeota archaeon]